MEAIRPICYAIMITPSSENARFTLKESVSGMVVIDVAISFAESRFIDFGDLKGIELSTAFEISSMSNISTVLMYGSWDQPVGKARG